MPKSDHVEPRNIHFNNKGQINCEDNVNAPQGRLAKQSAFVNYVQKDDMSSFGGRTLHNIAEEKEDEVDDDSIHQYPMASSDPNSTTNNVAAGKNEGNGSKETSVSIAEVAWMPDRLCKTCYSCDTPFTVFRRRHHFRVRNLRAFR